MTVGPSSPSKSAPTKAPVAKGADVKVVVAFVSLLLAAMIGLVVWVGRDKHEPAPPKPVASASTPPPPSSSTPMVIIVDPLSDAPPIIATAIPTPTQTGVAAEPPPRPKVVPKYSLGEDDPANHVLDTSAINEVINAQRPTLRAQCWEKVYTPASARIHLSIARDGSVKDVKLIGSSGPKEVGDCVALQAKSWKFPESSEGAELDYPFFFK